MAFLELQGFTCPYSEDTENIIQFQELPLDQSLEAPSFLKIIPNSANDRLIGVAGDLNITYKYDRDNPAHIQEINRLASLYETVDHDGIFTVIVDFGTYPDNTWKEHNQSDSSWASTILEYIKIKPDTSPVMLYRFIVDNLPTRFSYCKISRSSMSMNTAYPKTIFTYGNIVEVFGENGISQLLSDNKRKPYKITGPITITCSTAEAYVLVAEDIEV